jgi:hypothetical protein
MMLEAEEAIASEDVAGTRVNPAAAAAAIADAAPSPGAIRRMSVIHALELRLRTHTYVVTLLLLE